jgi:hypothetical protein
MDHKVGSQTQIQKEFNIFPFSLIFKNLLAGIIIIKL